MIDCAAEHAKGKNHFPGYWAIWTGREAATDFVDSVEAHSNPRQGCSAFFRRPESKGVHLVRPCRDAGIQMGRANPAPLAVFLNKILHTDGPLKSEDLA